MPIMDGAQLLRHLRALEAGASLPVIALSAGGPGARESALEAGANVFFDKPIRLAEVFQAVVDLLKLQPAA
jgi:CheY-like chemotaxis protein